MSAQYCSDIYTTIGTLKRILSNRTIKFNSLNNLDDLDEGISQDDTPYGRFIYISCWTADARVVFKYLTGGYYGYDSRITH